MGIMSGTVGLIENVCIMTGGCGCLMRLACSSVHVALLLLEPLASASCVHHATPHGYFDLFHLTCCFTCVALFLWFNLDSCAPLSVESPPAQAGAPLSVESELVHPSQSSPHPLRLALCPCSLLGRACAPPPRTAPFLPLVTVCLPSGAASVTVFRLPPSRGTTDTAAPGRRNVTAWGRARRGLGLSQLRPGCTGPIPAGLSCQTAHTAWSNLPL